MKITEIEALPITRPGYPLTIIVVLVKTDEGLTGIGEASLAGRGRGVIGIIEHARELLIGKDPAQIEHDLLAAGFTDIEFETVEKRSRSGSSRNVAMGMCLGSPLRSEIEERDPAKLDAAVEAATASLMQWEGVMGFNVPMSAHIVTAIK